MVHPYQRLVKSSKLFGETFKEEEMKWWRELTFPKNLTTGSKWDRPQLFACRVQIKNEGIPLLPIYKGVDLGALHDVGDHIKAFIKGPSTKDVRMKYEWVQLSGPIVGPIWSAMDNVKLARSLTEGDVSNTTKTTSQGTMLPPPIPTIATSRTRRDASTDVSYKQEPLSSPMDNAQPSDDSSDESHEELRKEDIQSEKHVVTLARTVIGHILDYSMVASEDEKDRKGMGFEFREELALPRLKAGKVSISAIDDGGIRFRSLFNQEIDNFVALIEAKKHSPTSDGSKSPYVSDKDLAQMAYEAILTRDRRGSEGFNDAVIIIHAARNSICFLQFQVTCAYIKDFKDGDTPVEPLYVSITKWFNLEQTVGRKGIVDNVRHIMARELARRE